MLQQNVLDQQDIQAANQSLQRPTKSHNLNVNSKNKAYHFMYENTTRPQLNMEEPIDRRERVYKINQRRLIRICSGIDLP
jgi:hypothetical protein